MTSAPPGDPADVKKTIQALRKKLSRWELDHLRTHCAELASQLEAAEAQIERLRAERDAAQRDAEAWREDVDGLVTALEAAGQQVGLTQGGAVVAVPVDDTEHYSGIEELLAALVKSGEELTMPELMKRAELPLTTCAESAMRSALHRAGFCRSKGQIDGVRRYRWKAPASHHHGYPDEPPAGRGKQSSQPLACHPQAQNHERPTPCSPPQVVLPEQTAFLQSPNPSPPPDCTKVDSLATEGGAQ